MELTGAGTGTITAGVDVSDRINSLSWGKNFQMYDYKHEVTVGRIKISVPGGSEPQGPT